MRVIFLRHGSRNFTIGDIPLNEQGLEEAKALACNASLQDIETILTSPKQRSQMTVASLATKIHRKPIVQESLDQMKSGESEISFHDRVQGFLNKIEEGNWPSPILLCSHSDWLAMAVSIIPTSELNLSTTTFNCAEFVIFDIEDGIWHKLEFNR